MTDKRPDVLTRRQALAIGGAASAALLAEGALSPAKLFAAAPEVPQVPRRVLGKTGKEIPILLIGGGDGFDIIDGGSGIDTAMYRTSSERVSVFLQDFGSGGSGSGGEAEGDRLISIENVYGSEFNDFIVGDANSNDLRGFGGNDFLSAAGGNDRVFGGEGNDTMRGGTGNDFLGGVGRMAPPDSDRTPALPRVANRRAGHPGGFPDALGSVRVGERCGTRSRGTGVQRDRRRSKWLNRRNSVDADHQAAVGVVRVRSATHLEAAVSSVDM